VRNLFRNRPTDLQIVDFVKVSSGMEKASPQTEASAKYENAVTFTSSSETIRTLATWIPATKQVLADLQDLMAFLNSSLMYAVNYEIESQLISGDATGQNLNGLTTQAQAFDTSLLVAAAGYTRIDCLARASQQIQADKEVMPNFAIVHPNDYWSIRLTKDSDGKYIMGDPMADAEVPSLFGLRLIPTTLITSGTFLVGSSAPECAEIRVREDLIVELSDSHDDYFVKNKIAARCEARLALVVYRPDAFVTGSFATSPSS